MLVRTDEVEDVDRDGDKIEFVNVSDTADVSHVYVIRELRVIDAVYGNTRGTCYERTGLNTSYFTWYLVKLASESV